MGTNKEDYVSLSQRISKNTGGIYGTPFLSAIEGQRTGRKPLLLRSKCMINQTATLLDILRDILLEPNFENRDRFRKSFLSINQNLKPHSFRAGHSAVMTRLKAHYHEAHWAAEQMGGR